MLAQHGKNVRSLLSFLDRIQWAKKTSHATVPSSRGNCSSARGVWSLSICVQFNFSRMCSVEYILPWTDEIEWRIVYDTAKSLFCGDSGIRTVSPQWLMESQGGFIGKSVQKHRGLGDQGKSRCWGWVRHALYNSTNFLSCLMFTIKVMQQRLFCISLPAPPLIYKLDSE
jgi:hypothetical protein